MTINELKRYSDLNEELRDISFILSSIRTSHPNNNNWKVYNHIHYLQLMMTWFEMYNEFTKYFEKVIQLQKDYALNLERINSLYNESIKIIERVNSLYNEFIRSYEKMNKLYEQQFESMQRMNQKWLDLFSKSWEQQQNEKR